MAGLAALALALPLALNGDSVSHDSGTGLAVIALVSMVSGYLLLAAIWWFFFRDRSRARRRRHRGRD